MTNISPNTIYKVTNIKRCNNTAAGSAIPAVAQTTQNDAKWTGALSLWSRIQKTRRSSRTI